MRQESTYVIDFQDSAPTAGFRLARAVLALLVCLICLGNQQVHADELVLDEKFTEWMKVEDFDICSCNSPIEIDQSGLLNENGEITTGQLYSFFKKQGIKSVDEIRLSLDVDPGSSRSDYSLDSIELSIEDFKYSLGNNTLVLPGYEASAFKPEAEIAIKLDYDFMERFNETSTEKLKFNYKVNGEERKAPIKVAVLPQPESHFSRSRILFIFAFAGFWVAVFMVLFRVTLPKPETARDSKNAPSPA